jgi:hypothetical protein
LVVVVVVVTQIRDHQVVEVQVVVLVLGLVVRRHRIHTILLVVQLDLHAKGMMVVIQTVVMQGRPVAVVPVALVVIVQVVALLLVQAV